MNILRNIILLSVFCLFSSALIGADKVAEQIVSNYKNTIESARADAIAKLKARQDSLAKAGKTEEAKEVEDMIAELEGEQVDTDGGNKEEKNEQLKKVEKFPEETIEFKGHHYLINNEIKTYPNTVKLCNDMGGHLMSIDNKDELKFFLKTIKKNKFQGGWWIQAIDEGKDKDKIKLLDIANKPLGAGINCVRYVGTFNYADGGLGHLSICEWDY